MNFRVHRLTALLNSIRPCTLFNDKFLYRKLASAWNHRHPWRC
ncbi:hypothetical protein ACFGOO_07060 [Treponema vincentii]